MNQREAQALWNRLRGQLLGLDKTLKEIVDNRAWEPLGYSSFSECWADQLSGVRLSGTMRIASVYALYDSGATTEEVSDAVFGLGEGSATQIQDAYLMGLSVEEAEKIVKVRNYTRNKPRDQYRITLDSFTEEEVEALKQIASDMEINYKDLASRFIRDGIDALRSQNA